MCGWAGELLMRMEICDVLVHLCKYHYSLLIISLTLRHFLMYRFEMIMIDSVPRQNQALRSSWSTHCVVRPPFRLTLPPPLLLRLPLRPMHLPPLPLLHPLQPLHSTVHPTVHPTVYHRRHHANTRLYQNHAGTCQMWQQWQIFQSFFH
jgi:hypothetical protein